METIDVISNNDIPEDFTGMAIYSDGTKVWLKDGEKHRENGPAVELVSGKNYWYLNGYQYAEEEYYSRLGDLTGKKLCYKCKSEIRERQLFLSSYNGCLC